MSSNALDKLWTKNTQNIKASIVVPTFLEQDNIQPLAENVFNEILSHPRSAEVGLTPGPASSGLWPVEMIIVDDNSPDDTIEIVRSLQDKGLPISIITRRQERGLSSAVLEGFRHASGSVLLCMDADLQHPPERVPVMLCELLDGHEYVLGTRYSTQGSFMVEKGWPMFRRVISEGARSLARPLSSLSDPMSGFFGVQRKCLEKNMNEISPIGFKVGLEIYVKCGIQSHVEVPIIFGTRKYGESKLSSKVMILYVKHLMDLYWFSFPRVIIVGLMLVLGLVMNLLWDWKVFRGL